MALAQEDIGQIQKLIQQELHQEPIAQANVRYELDLRERTVRDEEELKNQRDIILKGFEQSDKRFAEFQHNMDKRFEQVDKRFEQAQKNIDKRFEQVEKRFEQVDKRFEQVDKRFEQVDKRFDEMGKRLDRFMFWSLGITVSSAIFVVTYLK